MKLGLRLFWIGCIWVMMGEGMAQEVRLDTLPSRRPVFHLNLVGIGLGVETPLRTNLSLYLEGGLQVTSVATVKPGGDPSSRIIAIPYSSLQVRYFYNMKARQKKGERIEKFAANFLGISIPYIASTSYSDFLAGFGPVWGLQRNLGPYGFWGFHVGPGFYLASPDLSMLRLEVSVNTWLSIGFAF